MNQALLILLLCPPAGAAGRLHLGSDPAFSERFAKARPIAVLEEYAGLAFDGDFEVSFASAPEQHSVVRREDGSFLVRSRLPEGWTSTTETSVWHEVGHALFDEFAEANAPALAARGAAFARHPDGCYETWMQCAKENVVRAVAYRLAERRLGDEAAAAYLENEGGTAAWPFLPALAEVLEGFEAAPAATRSFKDLYPRLVAVFGAPAEPAPAPAAVYAARLRDAARARRLLELLPRGPSPERAGLGRLLAKTERRALPAAKVKELVDAAIEDFKRGKAERALRKLDKARAGGLATPDLLLTRATVLGALGRAADARAALQEALTLTDPAVPESAAARGLILHDLGPE